MTVMVSTLPLSLPLVAESSNLLWINIVAVAVVGLAAVAAWAALKKS